MPSIYENVKCEGMTMIKSWNAVVSKADVRFYPEVMASQIELVIQHERGNSLFRIPETNDARMGMYRIFNTGSMDDLKGRYCRASIDEYTGEVVSLKNIIYDGINELQNDPII